MDAKEYKEKKFDKLTRDVVRMVNATPSFGYGDVVDATIKSVLTNHLLTIVRLADLKENDIEILSQSVNDELSILCSSLVSQILQYKRDVECVSE